MVKLRDFFTTEELARFKRKESKPRSYADVMANPPPPVEWLVEPLFPLKSISVLGGDGSAGKSWICLLLSLSIASGQPFLGHFPTRKGKVLIVDEEAPLVLAFDRLKKLLKGMESTGHGIPADALKNIYTMNLTNVHVDESEGQESLKSYLEDYHPDLLIIDSLIRVHGADEISAQQMQNVFKKVREITAPYGTAVLFAHHTRKLGKGSNAPSQMLRGSSDIRNVVDSYVFVRKKAKGIRNIIHDKSRYEMEVPPFNILIEKVDNDTTVIKFEGFTENTTEPEQSKLEEAKNKIQDLLSKEPNIKIDREDVHLAVLDIGTNTKDNALKELVKEGKIKEEGGKGKTKKFWIEEG